LAHSSSNLGFLLCGHVLDSRRDCRLIIKV
jgi:hypothetical protein